MPDAGTMSAESPTDSWGLNFSRPDDDTLLVQLSGDWISGAGLPSAEEVEKQIKSGSGIQRVAMDTRELTNWDSGLLTFLINLTADLIVKGVRKG